MGFGHSLRVVTSVLLVPALMPVLRMHLLIVLPSSHHVRLLLAVVVHVAGTHLWHIVLLATTVHAAILRMLVGVVRVLLKMLHLVYVG